MTISRCDIAQAMLRDVFAEWADWPDELDTITGYTLKQYRALSKRLAQAGEGIEDCDERMLRQVAIQYSGYPGMATASVEAALGAEWRIIVHRAFLLKGKT